jgi:hypothetical protein
MVRRLPRSDSKKFLATHHGLHERDERTHCIYFSCACQFFCQRSESGIIYSMNNVMVDRKQSRLGPFVDLGAYLPVEWYQHHRSTLHDTVTINFPFYRTILLIDQKIRCLFAGQRRAIRWWLRTFVSRGSHGSRGLHANTNRALLGVAFFQRNRSRVQASLSISNGSIQIFAKHLIVMRE